MQHVIIKYKRKSTAEIGTRLVHRLKPPSRHNTSVPCRSNAGSASTTLAQNPINTGPTHWAGRGGSNSNPKIAQIRMITVEFQGIVNSLWKITVDLNSP